jgi:glycerophosphoryl diester phosphodiesterase
MSTDDAPASARLPHAPRRAKRGRSVALLFILGGFLAVLLLGKGRGCAWFEPGFPPFEVHGHRGAFGTTPPGNLPSSFLEGLRQRATSLEADTRLSADGHVVLHHDPRLAETCQLPASAKSTKVAELTLKELKAANCTAPGTTPEPVMTLVELLKLEDRGRFGFNVEIKPRAPEAAQAVLDTLTRFDKSCKGCLKGRVVLQSFQEEHLVKLNTELPKKEGKRPFNWRLSRLTLEPSEEELNHTALFADIYSPAFVDVPSLVPLVKLAHKKKLRLIPWTVNEEADICEVARLGADGVITDYPERATEIAAMISALDRRPKNCKIRPQIQ